MSFAQPLALGFLALFIPVILLYLLKQRRRHVRVSTLLFWDRILRDEHQAASYTRLRKWLSLLLQLLVIALLSLALARPLLSKDLFGARRIVVLLDVSASMTAQEKEGRRFDAAVARARDVIRGMAFGDSLMLVTVGAHVDVAYPFSSSRPGLLEALDKVQATHETTRFEDALPMLAGLPPDPRETCVYLITDGAFAPVPFTPPENMRFAYLPAGKAKDNIGVTAFQARPLPASPRDFEILFEALNTTEKQQTVPYEVLVDGNLLDAGELTLAPDERTVKLARQFTQQGGVVEVHLDYPDAFPLDNRAYTVLNAPARIPVRLVTAGNVFLEQALATDAGIALEVVPPESYNAAADGAAVTVFDNWAPPEAPAGPAVFLGAWPAALGITQDGTIEDALVTYWEREHPINRHLQLENITVGKTTRVTAPNAYGALISSFGEPLLLLGGQEKAQRLVAAFDMTTTDLPLRVAFPILMANSIRYLADAGADTAWTAPHTGDALTAEQVAAYIDRATEPDAVRALLAPDESAPPDTAPGFAPHAIELSRAGVYRAVTEQGETPVFAANLCDAAESRIAPSDTIPIQSESPLPELREGFRLGLEPSYFLLILACVLLAAEWVLFHRRIVE